jgi:nicotinamide-nucleotide amidase
MHENHQNLLISIFHLLIKKGLTIATAESCSGGLIAHTLTNISGSSTYFNRGVISYSNEAKIELLDVSQSLLKTYGAVSAEAAKAMAEGIRNKSRVDIGVSSTGIAGPSGGTKEKPVGLVYIAVATEKETQVKKFLFSGNRLENKESTCHAALQLLKEMLTYL